MLLIERQRKTLGLITSDVFQASPSHTVVSALCTRFWVEMPLGAFVLSGSFVGATATERGKEKGKFRQLSVSLLCHTTSGACRRCLSTGREELCSHSIQNSTPPVEVYFFWNNFQTRKLVCKKRCKTHQLRLGIAHPTRLGGAMRRSHAIAKKHAFLYVFSRAAKTSRWRHFCPPRSARAKAQHACVLRPPERGGAGCQ